MSFDSDKSYQHAHPKEKVEKGKIQWKVKDQRWAVRYKTLGGICGRSSGTDKTGLHGGQVEEDQISFAGLSSGESKWNEKDFKDVNIPKKYLKEPEQLAELTNIG